MNMYCEESFIYPSRDYIYVMDIEFVIDHSNELHSNKM